MPYEPDGSLTTDKQTIDDAGGWDTQTEWEAYQSASSIEITNGVVQLAEDLAPASGVARWAFENDMTDSWGSNDLTDQRSSGFLSGFAPIGNYAAAFDGSDDYAHATSAVIDFTSGVAQSLAFWVVMDDVSTFQRIINQNDNDNGIRVTYRGGDSLFSIDLENGGVLTEIQYSYSTTGSPLFLCLTKDASDNLTLYRNDAVQTTTATGACGTEPINTTFGAFDTNGTQEFVDGKLDLVDVYSKELTSTEVSNLYNTGSIE